MIALYRGSNVPTPKLSSCRRQNRRNRRFTFNSPCSPNNRSATKKGGWEERQQQKRETCSYPANPMTIHRCSSFMALPINKYTVEAHNNHFGTCQGILGIIPSQPQWGVFLFYCSKVSRTKLLPVVPVGPDFVLGDPTLVCTCQVVHELVRQENRDAKSCGASTPRTRSISDGYSDEDRFLNQYR